MAKNGTSHTRIRDSWDGLGDNWLKQSMDLISQEIGVRMSMAFCSEIIFARYVATSTDVRSTS